MNWSAVGSALNYDVDYKAASSSTWINAATGTTLLSVNLSGLNSSTVYDWRVRANCSGGSGNYVSSQFTTTAAGGACPGTYDVSTNGTTSGAATIPLNTDIKGTIGASGDNDYYKINITTGGSIAITLTTLPANYQLQFLNSAGGVLATSSNNGTADETININVSSNTTYYARVYPRNNGAWNATSCYTLRAGGGTASRGGSGDLITGSRLNIYPNPASSKLNVSIDDLQNNTVFKVYNVMGKLVMQQQANKTLTELNIAKLPAGIYLLNVNDTKGVRSMKFVKE